MVVFTEFYQYKQIPDISKNTVYFCNQNDCQ